MQTWAAFESVLTLHSRKRQMREEGHDYFVHLCTLRRSELQLLSGILGSVPLWFMALLLLLRSAIPLPIDTCLLENHKGLPRCWAWYGLILGMWSQICLVSHFSTKGREQGQKKCWLSTHWLGGIQIYEWKAFWSLGSAAHWESTASYSSHGKDGPNKKKLAE